MHTLFNLFGAPEDVAFRHTLTRAPYALMLSWIRCAEAMLRRLLLIEAAAFPKPNTRPLLHPSRQTRAQAGGLRLRQAGSLAREFSVLKVFPASTSSAWRRWMREKP